MSDSTRYPLHLDEADLQSDPELSRIIESHLKSRGRDLPAGSADLDSWWDAEYHGLHQVTLFQKATREQQREILAGCARQLLNEAYFIEKSGTAYCAKMILLAESTSIRQVYGLIAADEATHLQWIRPFIEESDRGTPDGPLLQFLSNLIERCDMNSLAFLVQIILEGWGLNHYRHLSRRCRHGALRDVFHAIYKDEALHHHTGEVVFDPKLVDTKDQQSLIRESLRGYSEMVRIGPQGTVTLMDQVLGGLDRKRKTEVFAELECEAQSQQKLTLLKKLMWGPGRERYVAELDNQGGFIPYSAADCAGYHAAHSP